MHTLLIFKRLEQEQNRRKTPKEIATYHVVIHSNYFVSGNPGPFGNHQPDSNARGYHVVCGDGRQVLQLQFLKECEWPYDELGPEGIPIGLSWLEVGIAIMIKLGTYLPVKRQGSDGETYLVFLPSLAAAQMHHVTLSELAQVANSLYHQVLNLIPERLTPDIPEGRVKSLYMLGESFQGTGLLLRPYFPSQETVVSLAQQYILSNRTLLDLNLPGCEQWPIDQRRNQTKWDQ